MFTQKQIKEAQKSIADIGDRTPVMFNALADPGRFKIFKLLLHYKNVCVTDIAAILNITVSAASQQLRILEMTGIAAKERMGQMICYKIRKDEPIVKSLIALVSKQ